MQLLRLNQLRHVGGSLDKFTSQLLIHVDLKFLDEPHCTVGVWSDLGLESYIVAEHTKDSYWVLNLMVGGGDSGALHIALDKCLELMEAKGITSFYYAFPQKWSRLYRSFWKSGVDRLRKYTIEDIELIAPGARPVNNWVWDNVMHNNISPMPILARKSFVRT